MRDRLKDVFNSHEDYRLLFSNFSWQAIERGSRLIAGAFTGILLANYLGPEPLGIYSYALSFIVLFAPLTNLGYNVLLPRDIVLEKGKWQEILGSSAFLRISGSIAAICLTLLFVHFSALAHGESGTLIIIFSLSFLFYPFDLFDIWFRARMVPKFASIAKITALVIINAFKVLFIYKKTGLESFAWLYVAEFVINGLLQFAFYLKTERGQIKKWSIRQQRVKSVIRETWPLFISLFSLMIYSRIDQVLIGSLLDKEKVGIFSAADKIAEMPLALILVLNGTLYPFLAEEFKKSRSGFNSKYLLLTEIYTLISYAMFLVVIPLAGWIIKIYPESFASAKTILQIDFIGVIFIFNGGLRNSVLSLIGKQKYILHTTVISAILNLLLNLYAIPHYGIIGAAWASSLAEFCSIFLLNRFIPALRPVFETQAKGLMPTNLIRMLTAKNGKSQL